MKLNATELFKTLQLEKHEVPAALILEGSWWQQQRNKLRLAKLERVRELPFPEMYLGFYQDRPVLYSCVYGAARAVEPVHVFASLGSSLAIQIGSCGAIQTQVHTGDVVLPTLVRIGEGASQYYGGDDWASVSTPWLECAKKKLKARGLTTHTGQFITTSALFAQPPKLVAGWQHEGHLGVDMETSAVFTAARAFEMDAVSMLFAWDELFRNHSFLDPNPSEIEERRERANLEIFEVALELAIQAEVKP